MELLPDTKGKQKSDKLQGWVRTKKKKKDKKSPTTQNGFDVEPRDKKAVIKTYFKNVIKN